MDAIQAIILALLQGATEFLPVSSSAHLILIPKLLGWEEQSTYFNLMVHLGTLTALIFYYRNTLTHSATQHVLQTQQSPVVLIAAASIPVFLLGYLLEDLITAHLYTVQVIAIATIVFALLLWFADMQSRQPAQHKPSLQLSHAVLIGMAQALALIPGTSRMGITLTAGLLLGFSKTLSAHFSMLLAIPVIVAATLYKSLPLFNHTPTETWTVLLIGFVVSGAFAFASIRLFIAFVERIGMLPFVVYRLLLGGVLLLFI